jgi:hypothetical protein
MPNIYIDHFTYQRSPSGLESASLLGNSMRLSLAGVVGANSLTVTPPTTVTLNQDDRITIFDGPNSEIVTVGAAGAVVGATSIPCSPLQFAHATRTPCCSDGILGSLADQIIDASAELEAIAYQSLFQATYTNEVLQLPSMDASITNRNILAFRPKHIPVTAITSIVLSQIQGSATTFDATQAFIDASQQYVKVPVLNGTSQGGQVVFWPQQPMNRTADQWLTISYTAGFAPSALPADIRDAAVLLTSDILSRRYNPTQADQLTENRKTLVAVLRGDFSGQSLFYKQAKRKLSKYTRKAI